VIFKQKLVLAHLDKRFAEEQLYSNAVKTSASSTPCIAARATRSVPRSKSAAKNDMLIIFIRSLPLSVSAYDSGNCRATPFFGGEIYNYRGSENIEGFCVSRSSVAITKNEMGHQQKPKSRLNEVSRADY